MFRLEFTDQAKSDFYALERDPSFLKQFKATRKALGYLQTNPRHPSLNTHEYHLMSGHYGEKIFTAYAQNKTPGAYRVFWHYGPADKMITIIAITPHP